MNSPRRLVESAQSPAEQVIANAAQVAPQPLPANEWAEVLKDAARPSRSAPWLLLLLAPAVVALLWLPLHPAKSELRPDENTRWVEVAPGELSLQSGRLAVTVVSKLKLTTPDLTVQSDNARFLAEVTENGTTLLVEDGEVHVRARGVEQALKRGESMTWPPIPEIPPQLAETPIQQAGDDGLELQSALYERGLGAAKRGEHEAALAAWRESLQKFPAGVLHPEVRLALFRELLRMRRFKDASVAGREFIEQCADDPRRKDVERLLQQLPQR